MTWTPERRKEQAERMKANRPIDAKLAGVGRGVRNGIPIEDRRLIKRLGEERDALKLQLSKEQALWEVRKAELLKQIKSLSNDNIADKFEVRPNQVNQILNGTAGMKL